MLVTELSELPELGRGKGIKIINVPSAKLKSREEVVAAAGVGAIRSRCSAEDTQGRVRAAARIKNSSAR